MATIPDDLLTVREVAMECRVTGDTVGNWIKKGVCGLRLTAMACGNSWRIRRADLEAWQAAVTEHKVPTPKKDVEKTRRQARRAEVAARERKLAKAHGL